MASTHCIRVRSQGELVSLLALLRSSEKGLEFVEDYVDVPAGAVIGSVQGCTPLPAGTGPAAFAANAKAAGSKLRGAMKSIYGQCAKVGDPLIVRCIAPETAVYVVRTTPPCYMWMSAHDCAW